MAHLLVNTARLSIESFYGQTIYVFWQSDECYKCLPLLLFSLSPTDPKNSTVLFTSYSSTTFLRLGQNETLNCNTPSLQNQAEYLIQVFENKSCHTTTITPAKNEYHPLVAVLLAQLIIVYLMRRGVIIWENYFAGDTMASGEGIRSTNENALDRLQETTPQAPRRLRSLDTFRGLSLFLMVFVNYGGGM
ncbi:heparan-alpha-glucosaminide N-acetyltransferase-like [Tropilaelaps mercedesae]|uniref:Heparan-alpha-glucosaminide N-acetyltransferase-like n=1 Tax=Tropilaelaps mercedesae TaxID=418985 RepID=A0A1V9XT42_9ACAR|nr:heparan-alpha-glucosaminide N-acetyltransferase-like [Tropilaelaps mercedesae]